MIRTLFVATVFLLLGVSVGLVLQVPAQRAVFEKTLESSLDHTTAFVGAVVHPVLKGASRLCDQAISLIV